LQEPTASGGKARKAGATLESTKKEAAARAGVRESAVAAINKYAGDYAVSVRAVPPPLAASTPAAMR
jgi:hypothetical protein